MSVTRDIRRLFGPRYAPEASRNVRHAALMRKAIELQPQAVLEDRFGFSSNKLTVVMGTNFTQSKLGMIQSSTVRTSPCYAIALPADNSPERQWPCRPDKHSGAPSRGPSSSRRLSRSV